MKLNTSAFRSNLEHFITKNSQYEAAPFSYPFNERGVDVAEEKEVGLKEHITTIQSPPKTYGEWRRSMIAGMPIDRGPSLKVTSREQQAGAVEDNEISSYRSVTEIYHAAETAEKGVALQAVDEEVVVESRELSDEEQLARCVLPIRGFGPRRLTEQEMGKIKKGIEI